MRARIATRHSAFARYRRGTPGHPKVGCARAKDPARRHRTMSFGPDRDKAFPPSMLRSTPTPSAGVCPSGRRSSTPPHRESAVVCGRRVALALKPHRVWVPKSTQTFQVHKPGFALSRSLAHFGPRPFFDPFLLVLISQSAGGRAHEAEPRRPPERLSGSRAASWTDSNQPYGRRPFVAAIERRRRSHGLRLCSPSRGSTAGFAAFAPTLPALQSERSAGFLRDARAHSMPFPRRPRTR